MLFVMLFFFCFVLLFYFLLYPNIMYTDGVAFNVVIPVARNIVLPAVKLYKYIQLFFTKSLKLCNYNVTYNFLSFVFLVSFIS